MKANLEIEDAILENINTMPLPAIKSFVYHMGNIGTYRQKNIDKVFNTLIQRDFFQDPYNTKTLLNSLEGIGQYQNEFILSALKSIENTFEAHERENRL